MTCPHCARAFPAAQKGDSCGECHRLLMGEPMTRPVPVLCMTYRGDDEEVHPSTGERTGLEGPTLVLAPKAPLGGPPFPFEASVVRRVGPGFLLVSVGVRPSYWHVRCAEDVEVGQGVLVDGAFSATPLPPENT